MDTDSSDQNEVRDEHQGSDFNALEVINMTKNLKLLLEIYFKKITTTKKRFITAKYTRRHYLKRKLKFSHACAVTHT